LSKMDQKMAKIWFGWVIWQAQNSDLQLQRLRFGQNDQNDPFFKIALCFQNQAQSKGKKVVLLKWPPKNFRNLI
jgi:hypothetical protein